MTARHFSIPIAVLALLHSAIAVRPTAMEQARAVTPVGAESGASRTESRIGPSLYLTLDSREAKSGEPRAESRIDPSLCLALDSREAESGASRAESQIGPSLCL